MPAFRQRLRRESARLRASGADRAMLTWAPLLGALLLAWIFSAATPTRLPIAVWDADHSALSRQLTRWLDAAPGLRVAARPLSAAEAERLLRGGQVHAVLAIPSGLARDIKQGRAAQVALLDNAQRGVHSGLIQKDVRSVVGTLSAGIEISARQKRGASPAAARAQVEPLPVAAVSLFNTAPDYQRFLGLALVAALLHVLAMSTGAWAVGRELREGTLPGWLAGKPGTAHGNMVRNYKNDSSSGTPGVPEAAQSHANAAADAVTPTDTSAAAATDARLGAALAALLAKLAWPFAAFSAVGALALAALTVGRGWAVPGSLALVVAAHTVFVALSLLLGALLTLLGGSQRMGLSASGFIAAPAFAFSGMGFPWLALPTGAQWWATLLPYTHYLRVQVAQLLMGAPAAPSLAVPLGMAAACAPLALLAAWQLARLARRPERWGQR